MENKHFEHYLSLLLILSFGALGAILIPAKQSQMLIISLTTFLYIGWGIFHHYLNHDLATKIVIEYVLMGSFGMAIMLFIIRGGI